MENNSWIRNLLREILFRTNPACNAKIMFDNLPDESKDVEASVEYILQTALNEDERNIIIDKFKEGLTIKEICRIYGLSDSRVDQIKNKAISKLCSPHNFNIMVYGVRGYIDNEVKKKIGDHVDSALLPFLNDELRYLLKTIKDLQEHAENFTKEPYISCYSKDKHIEELEFSVKTYNCLKRSAINLVSDILNNREKVLHGGIRNLGKKGRDEVVGKMKSIGFTNFDLEDE